MSRLFESVRQIAFVDVMEPAVYPLMQMVADAARTWDGSKPVRELRL